MGRQKQDMSSPDSKQINKHSSTQLPRVINVLLAKDRMLVRVTKGGVGSEDGALTRVTRDGLQRSDLH